MRDRTMHHLAVIITMLCLSFIGIFVKLIQGTIHPMTISFFRTALGFAFLLALVPRLDPHFFYGFRREIKHYAVIGFLMAVGFTLTMFALTYAPISNFVLITTTSVLFVALFASHFLHERITKREKGAIALGVLGVVVMNPFHGGYLLGNVLSLLVAIVGALLTVFMRQEEKTHTIGTSVWFLLFATIFLLPAPFIWGWGDLAGNWFWLLMLGVLCTGLAYLLLSYGLQKIKAEDVSIISMICQPMFAILLAYFLLSEIPSSRMLAGGVILMVAGIVLETKKVPLPNILVRAE